MLKTTTTAGGGLYSFTNLIPGDYIVGFTKGAYDGFSPQDQGGDDDLDSDADTSTGKTGTVSLSASEDDTSVDCGLYEFASISDGLVWEDTDGDDVQDGGESGIDGVTVTLYESDGTTVITTTTTAGGGLYSFADLIPKSYIVGFAKAAGFDAYSLKDQGGDDDIDSDADDTSGKTDGITLASGEDNSNTDNGQYKYVAFSNGRVWKDDDSDGTQDGGESGIDGCTVRLIASDGLTEIDDTPTAGGGLYSFSNLKPGKYHIKFDKKSGNHHYSLKDNSGDDDTDSDADTSTGQTDQITLNSGQTNSNTDCGQYEKGSISDYVWIDIDNDGIQDGGESGYDGMTVTLYQSDGSTVISTFVTIGGGLYGFDDVHPGTYVIGFALPANYNFSPQDAGGDDALDSDANTTTGKTASIVLTSGENDTSVDAGINQLIDLDINKVVDNATPNVNDNVVFTITLENTDATLTATNINITDNITSDFTYQSHIESGGTTYTEATDTWVIPTLGPGVSVTLAITVKVLASGDNTASLTSFDQVDPISANNSGYAAVTVAGASGGGGGGIESNGSMAGQMATRNFTRLKTNKTKYFDNKSELLPYREFDVRSGLLVPASSLKSETSNILDFIPEKGPSDANAHIVTPEDLLLLSNAVEVFSVDYFRYDNKRLASILAMTTRNGAVYNHTKMVCDRLTGGNLQKIDKVNIKDHVFIRGMLVQANGEVDYTISFIAYESGGSYVVDNQWLNEDYIIPPLSDVFNFQVWSASPEGCNDLAEEILDRMDKDKGLLVLNNGNQRIPQVYVRNGYYKDGALFLNIRNLVDASEITISGVLTRTEEGETENFRRTISLNPNNSLHQLVEIPTGYIFDIGFGLFSDKSPERDELYFADGPWGKYTEATGGRIDSFEVYPHSANNSEPDEYILERDASITGEVKTYVSLFKSLIVGNRPVDLSSYNQLEFTANGSATVELIVALESIESWSDQPRRIIHLEPEVKTYTINYFELICNNPSNSLFTGEDVVSVVFNAIGNNATYTDFEMNISDLKFKNGITDVEFPGMLGTSINNFPNPFTHETTISFDLNKDCAVRIMLFNLAGQEIRTITDKQFKKGNNRILFKREGIKDGTYILKLFSDYSSVMKKITIIGS